MARVMPIANRDSQDELFMTRALTLARKALLIGQLPIGAALVLDQEVIAEAYCSDKGLRRLHHPELLVLLVCDGRRYDLQERRNMTLYTNLEPCVMCFGAAMSCCVGRIVYGLSAPVDGALSRVSEPGLNRMVDPEYTSPDVVGSVLRHESYTVFEAFVAQWTDPSMVSFAKRILAANAEDPYVEAP